MSVERGLKRKERQSVKRSARSYALPAAFLLAAVSLLVFYGQAAKKSRTYDGQITFAAQGTAYDAEFLRDVVEPRDDPQKGGSAGGKAANDSGTEDVSEAELTAWTEKRSETVYDEDSRREYRADVMLVYGNSGNLIPYGAQLHPEDEEGCLVSRDVAERLFGTSDAAGHMLRYGSRDWVVRGILTEPEGLVMLQASGILEEAALDRLTVRLTGDVSPRLAGQRLMTAHDISGTQIRLDYYEDMSFLTELIPGKWSDLQGWKDNWETMRENLEQISMLKAGAQERQLMSLSRQRRLSGVGGGVCLAAALLLFLRTVPGRRAADSHGTGRKTAGVPTSDRSAGRRGLLRRPLWSPAPWKGARRSGFFRRFRDSDR